MRGCELSQSGTLRQAKIALYSPELAQELAMPSSRDRIARGPIVNANLSTIFVFPRRMEALLIGSSVNIGAFEKLSYAYELCAERVVDEKLEREAHPTRA